MSPEDVLDEERMGIRSTMVSSSVQKVNDRLCRLSRAVRFAVITGQAWATHISGEDTSIRNTGNNTTTGTHHQTSCWCRFQDHMCPGAKTDFRLVFDVYCCTVLL
jgi:hypothetical protein